MRIDFEGAAYDLLPGEPLLSGLERQGAQLPSFCRTGACQTCLVKAKRGRPPALSQVGLKDLWVAQGLFLACMCVPQEPMEVERCEAASSFASRVERVERLTQSVLRVELQAPAGFEYLGGQFVQLARAGGVMRPYSLASVPGSDRLELHVALFPGGAMSEWLLTATGQEVTLRGPFGECFYFAQEPERPLLLAGTGTGLAPLLGVARAARAAGHRAPIHLYHGSPSLEGLYLWAELAELARQMPLLHVFGSVLSGVTEGARDSERCRVLGEALDRALVTGPLDPSDCRVYLCGQPEFVQRLKKRLYLAGTPLARIHADPFVTPAART